MVDWPKARVFWVFTNFCNLFSLGVNMPSWPCRSSFSFFLILISTQGYLLSSLPCCSSFSFFPLMLSISTQGYLLSSSLLWQWI
jgi:hypothetical protein